MRTTLWVVTQRSSLWRWCDLTNERLNKITTTSECTTRTWKKVKLATIEWEFYNSGNKIRNRSSSSVVVFFCCSTFACSICMSYFFHPRVFTFDSSCRHINWIRDVERGCSYMDFISLKRQVRAFISQYTIFLFVDAFVHIFSLFLFNLYSFSPLSLTCFDWWKLKKTIFRDKLFIFFSWFFFNFYISTHL